MYYPMTGVPWHNQPVQNESRKMAEAKSEKRTYEPASAFDGKSLFRSLRVDEDWRNGLSPRDPSATCTVSQHLNGAKKSQFISTTATFDDSQRWASLSVKNKKMKEDEVRIVQIDAEKISKENIIDLTNPAVLNTEIPLNQKLRNFATYYQEILVKGNIAADCITLVYSAHPDNLSLVYPADDDSLSPLTEQMSELNIWK